MALMSTQTGGGAIPAENQVSRPLAVLDDPVREIFRHDEDVPHGKKGL